MTIDTERSFARKDIVARLRSVMASGRAILGAGCSAGLVARSAEAGGADLIVVYSTGKSRLMGLPTTPIGHSNPITMSMYAEIDNVVVDTPIIGGAEATDPTYQRIRRLVRDFRDTGFDGLINFPSVGKVPQLSDAREHVGQGVRREAELIAAAREMDFFTMGYAYHEEHARLLAAAGVDVLVPHAGWTTGGGQGAGGLAASLEASADLVARLFDIGRRENPDIICLAHGGSIATPEDTEFIYRHAGIHGFVGASSIERIPIEQAVEKVTREFRAIRTRPAGNLHST